MPERFTLSLGGIPISLIPDLVEGDYEFVRRAVNFISTEPPVISLQVHSGWFPDLSGELVHFDTNHSWQLLQVDGKLAIQVHSPGRDPEDPAQPYQLGIFAPDFRSGDIYVAENQDDPGQFVFPFSYPLGELFMMSLLGTGLGMLFHAAGVIDQGKGYLFTGHGGAGKTTTANLWEKTPGATVVNDDKVIIRQVAGGFRLYGSPWHGEGGMALPDSAPLKKVFILKQASENYLAPLKPVQAAGLLLARTFVPLWDAEKISFSLKFLDELCRTVPCHELGFIPDSSAVEFVRSL